MSAMINSNEKRLLSAIKDGNILITRQILYHCFGDAKLRNEMDMSVFLEMALMHGRVSVISVLFEYPMHLECDEMTKACLLGNKEKVSQLLRCVDDCCDVSDDEELWNPYAISIALGYTDIFQLLLDGKFPGRVDCFELLRVAENARQKDSLRYLWGLYKKQYIQDGNIVPPKPQNHDNVDILSRHLKKMRYE